MSGAFFDPLMSGSKNERAHEIKVRERAHMSAITLTRAHDQHLYFFSCNNKRLLGYYITFLNKEY